MFVTHDIDSRFTLIKEGNEVVWTPIVVRVNKFDEEAVEEFAKSMSAAASTGQTVIPVVIDSFGGECYALLAMVDIIARCPVPVATIVEGKAMSCGAVLFTCGKEGMRFMGPNATLMIHDVSSMEPYKKCEEIKVDTKETVRLNKVLYKIMAKNCGKPEKYFDQLVKQKLRVDWYLDAKEAILHNLANQVGIPTFRVNVKIDMSLEYIKLNAQW